MIVTESILSPDDNALPLPLTGQPNTLTAHATAVPDGVVIPLADTSNPELQAEIRLDQDVLTILVRRMVQIGIAEDAGRWLLDQANALVQSEPEVSLKRRCPRCGAVNDVTAGPAPCSRCGLLLTA